LKTATKYIQLEKGMDEIPSFTIEFNEPQPKKQRFATLHDEQLDEIVESASAKSTKYATTYAVSVFKGT